MYDNAQETLSRTCNIQSRLHFTGTLATNPGSRLTSALFSKFWDKLFGQGRRDGH